MPRGLGIWVLVSIANLDDLIQRSRALRGYWARSTSPAAAALGWPHAVEAIGKPGLHFHDLRTPATSSPPTAGPGARSHDAHGPRLRARRDALRARGAARTRP